MSTAQITKVFKVRQELDAINEIEDREERKRQTDEKIMPNMEAKDEHLTFKGTDDLRNELKYHPYIELPRIPNLVNAKYLCLTTKIREKMFFEIKDGCILNNRFYPFKKASRNINFMRELYNDYLKITILNEINVLDRILIKDLEFDRVSEQEFIQLVDINNITDESLIVFESWDGEPLLFHVHDGYLLPSNKRYTFKE